MPRISTVSSRLLKGEAAASPDQTSGTYDEIVQGEYPNGLTLPSLKLTYPLKIDPWKRRFLLETIILGAMLVLGSVDN